MSVVLVQFSALDLGKFLPIGQEALGRRLSAAADASGKTPPLHHILCVAALKNEKARISPEECTPYLNMFHAGFLIGVDERDCAEILEVTGMPAIMVESVQRGLNVVFIAGTLVQWRQALIRGCDPSTSSEVRHIFNQIFSKFSTIGLEPVLGVEKKPNSDQTFSLLEG